MIEIFRVTLAENEKVLEKNEKQEVSGYTRFKKHGKTISSFNAKT